MTTFAAGLVSFLSPCVLPLVPGYVSYVAGESLENLQRRSSAQARLSAAGLSLFFVLGFSTVFVALGASATALGRLLLAYRYQMNIVGGAIVILFGLLTTGTLRLPWLQREFRFVSRAEGGHPFGAYVLGLAFAFGWTPCIGPVLGAILTVSASATQSFDGVSLLSIYSLGLGVPFLLAALFMASFLKQLRKMRRFGRAFELGAGTVMVIMGIAMITGYMSAFSYWLLDMFPVLATIG
ncbi:MAG TPA: cytochrome c biogenesis protein CcdA [Stellaceae bacterium]|nr:cytochrome c biogenesis protein CcdA [Stellaceae bacterium]